MRSTECLEYCKQKNLETYMKARHEFSSEQEYQEYLRTYFAAMAMQGILSGYRGNAFFAERIASDSVMLADVLINELNKDALIDQLNK